MFSNPVLITNWKLFILFTATGCNWSSGQTCFQPTRPAPPFLTGVKSSVRWRNVKDTQRGKRTSLKRAAVPKRIICATSEVEKFKGRRWRAKMAFEIASGKLLKENGLRNYFWRWLVIAWRQGRWNDAINTSNIRISLKLRLDGGRRGEQDCKHGLPYLVSSRNEVSIFGCLAKFSRKDQTGLDKWYWQKVI